MQHGQKSERPFQRSSPTTAQDELGGHHGERSCRLAKLNLPHSPFKSRLGSFEGRLTILPQRISRVSHELTKIDVMGIQQGKGSAVDFRQLVIAKPELFANSLGIRQWLGFLVR